MEKKLIFEQEFFLSAGECNPQGFMPVTLLVERLIEVATAHANHLEIGYEQLKTLGIGWVLSRLSIQMERWPSIDEHYRLRTWVEDWNRLYTHRCFVIEDGAGIAIGHARTMWVAIDIKLRRASDLTVLQGDRFICNDLTCPVPPQKRMPALPIDADTGRYTFLYCDLDCNGHVNTVRYLEHIMNLKSPAFYAANRMTRFEVAFLHECYWNETVALPIHETGDAADPAAWYINVDIVRETSAESTRCVSASFTYRQLPQ